MNLRLQQLTAVSKRLWSWQLHTSGKNHKAPAASPPPNTPTEASEDKNLAGFLTKITWFCRNDSLLSSSVINPSHLCPLQQCDFIPYLKSPNPFALNPNRNWEVRVLYIHPIQADSNLCSASLSTEAAICQQQLRTSSSLTSLHRWSGWQTKLTEPKEFSCRHHGKKSVFVFLDWFSFPSVPSESACGEMGELADQSTWTLSETHINYGICEI